MRKTMSLFDTIHCKRALPDDAPEFVKKSPVFQTYDLGRGCGDWTITEEGELRADRNIATEIFAEALNVCIPPVMVRYKRKRIEMYATNLRGGGPRGKKYVFFTENGEDCISITYVVQIRNGKVSSIREKWRQAQPALPLKEMR